MNESTLLTFFSGQGPWALLFVALLIWSLKQSRDRENKLHDLIEKLSGKYDEMAIDLKQIKTKLWGD